MERETNLYWIKFNWPKYAPARVPVWEPASHDPITNTWLLIGSNDEYPNDSDDILEVSAQIMRPEES